MSPRLDEFTTEQLKFALTAIKSRMDVVVTLSNHDQILAGECREWEALATFKVQLTMALERSEKVDKTWSN